MDSLVAILGVLAITIIIFLICRELVCWYFKFNQMIALLETIRDRLPKRD
jgi:hypothetical protein